MTTQIKRRRGTAAEHTSFTGADAELTVNTTNKSVHVHDGTTVGGHELARADGSNLAVSGNDITFGDNDKAIFGAGSDLQIYHNGAASFIDEVGTGPLKIRTESFVGIYNSDETETIATFADDGAVRLYHDNSAKLATTSTGIDVTGTVTTDGLTVEAPSLATITVTDNSPSNVSLSMGAGNSSVSIGSTTSDPLTFLTANTERMRIDSSGNVGIGTSSPGARLTIQGSFGSQLTLQDIATNNANKGATFTGAHYSNAEEPVLVASSYSTATENICYYGGGWTGANAATQLRFYTGANSTTTTGSEAARIDSSGNLLVGKTAQGSATVGAEMLSSGTVIGTRSGSTAGRFNRTSSDGDIVDFRKDNTTVGSIGTESDDVFIESSASNHSGLRFGASVIWPRNNGSLTNNVVDLGANGTAFKDLYLSGGVYLGGTGSANKLDDYEEGVQTNTTVDTSTSGTITLQTAYDTIAYTKIGRLVHIQGFLRIDSVSSPVGTVRIYLPFTASSSLADDAERSGGVGCLFSDNSTGTQTLSGTLILAGDNKLNCFQVPTASLANGDQIYLDFSYVTDS